MIKSFFKQTDNIYNNTIKTRAFLKQYPYKWLKGPQCRIYGDLLAEQEYSMMYIVFIVAVTTKPGIFIYSE